MNFSRGLHDHPLPITFSAQYETKIRIRSYAPELDNKNLTQYIIEKAFNLRPFSLERKRERYILIFI